jgi:hypothetical protein
VNLAQFQHAIEITFSVERHVFRESIKVTLLERPMKHRHHICNYFNDNGKAIFVSSSHFDQYEILLSIQVALKDSNKAHNEINIDTSLAFVLDQVWVMR